MINRDRYSKKAKRSAFKRLAEDAGGVQAVTGTVSEDKSTDERAVKKTSATGRVFRFVAAIVVCALLVGLWIVFREEIVGFFRPSADFVAASPAFSYTSKRVPLLDVTESARCERISDSSDPDIQASAYIAVYADTFQVAAQDGPNSRLPFASIVKLLGALEAIEYYALDDELGLLAPVDSQGNGMELEVGEKVQVEDLIGAVIVGSKNDAMYVLAQNYPGGEQGFVDKIQDRADSLGMSSTSIVNPIGFDDPLQYSTVRDIAILAVAAMRNPVIREYAAVRRYELTTSSDRLVTVDGTNGLLGEVDGVVGVKTGYTEGAGLCLATYYENGNDFVTVVLNAEDRVEESRKLIEWVQENYNCP